MSDFPPITYSTFFVPCVLQAAKKADCQAEELASILHDRDSEIGRKINRSKVYEFANNVFGSCHSKIPEVLKNGSTEQNGNVAEKRNNMPDKLTLLQLLALNALDLTAPASNVLLKNRLSNWVQLSGHEGSFSPAGPGTIWKKCGHDRIETGAYKKLMSDVLSQMVPQFYKDIEYNGQHFIEMQDLLYGFKNPSIMDIKVGIRTFLESEVQNNKERPDLFTKMVKIDSLAPTTEEREAQGITKLRYMQFRDNLSSSADLSFRIQGFKIDGQEPTKDLQHLKSRDEICRTLRHFLAGSEKIRIQLISRLQNLRHKLEKSNFFHTHEVIGSSLLIIHDKKHAGAWMIDFAKTIPLPEGVCVNHKSQWVLGNHEDGYLLGLENLISILKDCEKLRSKGHVL